MTTFPETTFTLPNGINDAGVVAGTFGTGATEQAATFDGRAVTSLGNFGGMYARSLMINNQGWVVSVASFTASGQQIPVQHVFVWSGSSTIQLASLDEYGEYPTALNDDGIVVGGAAGHAIKWVNGAATILGELPGDNGSGATSINSSGSIVGFSSSPQGELRAVLWNSDGPVDINTMIPSDSGWNLVQAEAINDAGQITGWGYYNGDQAAFLLTPMGASLIPEPTTCALAGSAFVGLLFGRRRQ